MEEKLVTNTDVQDSSNQNVKIISLQSQTEQMLFNATLITELALDIKERSVASEKYASNLRNFAIKTCKAVATVQNSSKVFLSLAQKSTVSAIKLLENIPGNDQKLSMIKLEYDKLLNILDKEIADIDDLESLEYLVNQNFNDFNLKCISDKIKFLEEKQKFNDSCIYSSNSTRSFKSDFDEKYPEKLPKDCMLDLNNVVNLPPVPEDIFTTFQRPKRTSSLSSLKHLRKMKLCLQRAESVSDDEEDWEENSTTSRFLFGDGEELDMKSSHLKNSTLLDDIQEEK